MGITKSKDAVKEPRFSNVEELLVSQLFQKISNAKKTFNKQEFSVSNQLTMLLKMHVFIFK